MHFRLYRHKARVNRPCVLCRPTEKNVFRSLSDPSDLRLSCRVLFLMRRSRNFHAHENREDRFQVPSNLEKTRFHTLFQRRQLRPPAYRRFLQAETWERQDVLLPTWDHNALFHLDASCHRRQTATNLLKAGLKEKSFSSYFNLHALIIPKMHGTEKTTGNM